MKKIIALALSLMMLLACVSAIAEGNTITVEGVFELKFGELPEGYVFLPVEEDPVHDFSAVIYKEDGSAPSYSLIIDFNDMWSGLNTWADATENDITAVEDDFYEFTELDYGDIDFGDFTTSTGIKVLNALEKNGVFGALYTIYNSHEIEVDMVPAEDAVVTATDLENLINFVDTAEIVPLT